MLRKTLAAAAFLCAAGCSHRPAPKVQDLVERLEAAGLSLREAPPHAPTTAEAVRKARRLAALAVGAPGVLRTEKDFVLSGYPLKIRKFKDAASATAAARRPARPAVAPAPGGSEGETTLGLRLQKANFLLELEVPIEEEEQGRALMARIERALAGFPAPGA